MNNHVSDHDLSGIGLTYNIECHTNTLGDPIHCHHTVVDPSVTEL